MNIEKSNIPTRRLKYDPNVLDNQYLRQTEDKLDK